nr:glycosyltransferase [Deltaproteobacteria bacterium]
PVPANLVTMRLMQRRYVDSLIEHQDREVFMAGLWAITGFTQVPHLITKGCRGSTNYGISRKISILVNSITSFSNKPLSLIFYLGCIIILIATAAASYLLARKIFFGVAVSGWTSLILSVWLLGGITTFCLGVIGIYVSKIFSETKRRPYTIIKHIYQASHDHKNISDKH